MLTQIFKNSNWQSKIIVLPRATGFSQKFSKNDLENDCDVTLRFPYTAGSVSDPK